MTGPSQQPILLATGQHDLAIVRALAAVLEDAISRADFATARDLAEQLADEIQRQGARSSER